MRRKLGALLLGMIIGGLVLAQLMRPEAPQPVTRPAVETAERGERVKEIKDRWGRVVQRRIYRAAPAACTYLQSLGLVTGDYWRDTNDDQLFHCLTPYQDLGVTAGPTGLKNNLAYYVYSDAERIHEMKLVLNINQRQEAEQAHQRLVRAADLLTQQALSSTLPTGVQQAIVGGHSWQGTIQGTAATLTRINWPTGIGYELQFKLTTPAVSAPPAQTPQAGAAAQEQRREAERRRWEANAQHRQEFLKAVRAIDPAGLVVAEVAPAGLTPDHVRVAVSQAWHGQPYQVRLQGAQALWQGWASIHAPADPDRASLELVDRMGNPVGGSRVWAGSLIWVQER